MIDILVSTLFQSLRNEKNYLRINSGMGPRDASLLDIATTKNMQTLIQIGDSLLNKPVSRVNFETN
ncbi:patatin 3, partial [Olea europaea subsp. europaea]